MQVSENKLVLGSGKKITFNYSVWKVLDIDPLVIVLLDTLAKTGPLPCIGADVNATKGRNVFGISKADGSVVWQIVPVGISPGEVGEAVDAPYVAIYREDDGVLRVGNWGGYSLHLDPATGKEVRMRTWAK